jgi:hypothetical protein
MMVLLSRSTQHGSHGAIDSISCRATADDGRTNDSKGTGNDRLGIFRRELGESLPAS